MSEIKIESPVNLEFTVLETDDRIPSFKLELKIIESGFKDSIQITRTFWIKNEDWDQFINNQCGELIDISGLWIIRIYKHDLNEETSLSINFSSKSLKGVQQIELAYYLSNEDLFNIVTKITSFPKWW